MTKIKIIFQIIGPRSENCPTSPDVLDTSGQGQKMSGPPDINQKGTTFLIRIKIV